MSESRSLNVSSDGRKLVRPDGTPFFYLADMRCRPPAQLGTGHGVFRRIVPRRGSPRSRRWSWRNWMGLTRRTQPATGRC